MSKSCNTVKQLDRRQAVAAADILKSLGHPLRLLLVQRLAQGSLHVKGLAEHLEVAPAIVSQQLRILKTAGLVTHRTESGHAYYEIREPHLLDMLGCIGNCLAERNERGG